jgi:hypothetical protein
MKSFADVLVDLQQVNADLSQLIDHVGGFADWWLLAETKKGFPLNLNIPATYFSFGLQVDRATAFN